MQALDAGHVAQIITRLPRLASAVYMKTSPTSKDLSEDQQEPIRASPRDQKGTWENGLERTPLPESYLSLFDDLAALALSPRILGRLTTRQHSNILWSIARLGLGRRNPNLTKETLNKLLGIKSPSILSKGNAIDVSNTAWAVARLLGDGQLASSGWSGLYRACEILLDASDRIAREMGPQEVSNTLWSFGKIISAADRDQSFDPDHDGSSKGSCSSLPGNEHEADKLVRLLQSRALNDSLASRAVDLAEGNAFGPQHLPQLAWACSKIALPPNSLSGSSQPRLIPIIDAVSSNAMHQLRSLSAKGLSIIAWSLANLRRLGHQSPAHHRFISQGIAKAAVWKARKFNGQGLSNLSWALSSFGLYDPSLYGTLAKEALYKLDSMSPLALTTLLWSWAEAGYCQVSLFEAVGREAVKKLDDFRPMTLARLLTACSKVGHVDPRLLLASSSVIRDWAQAAAADGSRQTKIEDEHEQEKLMTGAALAAAQALQSIATRSVNQLSIEQGESVDALAQTLSTLCSVVINMKRQRSSMESASLFGLSHIKLAVAVASLTSLYTHDCLCISIDYSRFIVVETQSIMRSISSTSARRLQLQQIVPLVWASYRLMHHSSQASESADLNYANQTPESADLNQSTAAEVVFAMVRILNDNNDENGSFSSHSRISPKWLVLLIWTLSLSLCSFSLAQEGMGRKAELVRAITSLFDELSLILEQSESQGRSILSELNDEVLANLATALSSSSPFLPHDSIMGILFAVASEGYQRLEAQDQRLRSHFESRIVARQGGRAVSRSLDLSHHDQRSTRELAEGCLGAWTTIAHHEPDGQGREVEVSRTIKALQRMASH